MAQSATAFASASLYVGDLNNDVNETTLFETFSQVGPVASIRVCRDAVSRRSLGYAYVNFHSVVDAERALDTLNFSPIKNRPCRIMWSQRDPSIRKSGVGNIFIKNLEKSIDNKELYDTFSMFGNILSAKIALSHDGESLGYGFVHFDSDEPAAKAIERVNGMLLKDRKVIVTAFMSKDRRPGDKNKFTNVYVKELPDNCDKDKLDAIFSQFGVISNSALAVNKDGKAFGFVNFETVEQALASVEHGNGMEVEGRKLVVCRAQKKSEREKELRERYESMKAEKQKKFAGLNLYVKNVADEMTDEDLLAEFAKFGSITSSKIMRDEITGRSRGFGFVCFTAPEDATRALTELHNKMVHNKPLYVALAVRKDVRRAQLEMLRQKGLMPQGMFPPSAPMFYGPGPGMPGRPGFPPMYHPQMMPPHMGRGGFRGPFGPMGPGGRGPMPPQGFTLVPAGPNGMHMGPNGGRGPRPPRQNGPNVAVPTQPGGPAMQQQRPQQRQGGAPGAQQGARAAPAQARKQDGVSAQVPGGSAMLPGGAQPLTIETLVQASPEMQKQIIGERLFPKIAAKQPDLAGKITGMLLEMENSELLELLDSEDALNAKIKEALIVLEAAASTQ